MRLLTKTAVLAAALLLIGCGDSSDPQTDHAPGVAPADDTRQPSDDTGVTGDADGGDDSPESNPDAPPPTHTAEGLVYTVPDGWTVGAARQMRVLTLMAGDGVEVAVAKWPTGVGDFDTNLMRWFGQAGYNPADAAQTDAARAGFVELTLGDAEATWAPLLDGDGGTPMIAVWAPRGADPTPQSETWTLKITGDADALRAKQDQLRAWAESLSFE